MSKKEIREAFRNACFERDKRCCAMCGHRPTDAEWAEYDKGGNAPLDAHHIADRHYMPYGGYVKANGISLCPRCHEYAEHFHVYGVSYAGYSPSDLYRKIHSCYDRAWSDSLALGDKERASFLALMVSRIQQAEWDILDTLDESELSRSTWDLACEEFGVTDDVLKSYGKGRNAIN